MPQPASKGNVLGGQKRPRPYGRSPQSRRLRRLRTCPRGRVRARLAPIPRAEGCPVSVSVIKHKNLVGGDWVDAASGETMEVLNPSTGEVIAEVPRSSTEDVERAVAAARKAYEEWADRTPKDRMELLLKLGDVIDENADELTRLESQNVGKPMAIAGDEMPFSADNLRFFAGAARTLEGKAAGEYVEGYTSIIRREPLGIVAGITPWNYPLMMAIWKLGPAL